MILYASTRGEKKLCKFSEVILKGIASDGGLFIPREIPQIRRNEIKNLINQSYQEIALFLLNKFETDLSRDVLKGIVHKAYGHNFDTTHIAPLHQLKDNQYILELWHGPTLAFKDMALQMMPHFFVHAIKSDNQKRKKQDKNILKYLILVATSGDTGKAALEGYKDLEGISIIVFYPKYGVSRLQKISMITQEGNNVKVVGMKGNFDDAQRSVKDVFKDEEFNEKLLKDNNIVLTSANSINWGRLMPQIVYHLSSYLDLLKKRIIKLGDEIDIAVPTGNFGNIMAAFYVKEMGLPVRRLICASNANNVLTDFINRGIYRVEGRSLIKTPSPAMDILVASNIERLLFEITKDQDKILSWMKKLNNEGRFSIDPKTKKILKEDFYADWVSNNECLETIKKTYNETNYLLDPHTAVAQTVVERYKIKYGSEVPVVICSTANWAKFPKDVYQGLTGIKSTQGEFEILNNINRFIPDASIPRSISRLQNKKIRHTARCRIGKEEIKKVILQSLSKCYNENN